MARRMTTTAVILPTHTRVLSDASGFIRFSISDDASVAVATVALFRALDPQPEHLQNWSNANPMTRFKTLLVNDEVRSVSLTATANHYEIGIGEQTVKVDVARPDNADEMIIFVDGVRHVIPWAFDGACVYVRVGDRQIVAQDDSYKPARSADESGSGQIAASTEGLLVKVAVAAGDRVAEGDLLAVVEAMKMEHRHLADGYGVVSEVLTSEGVQVKKNQLLISLVLDSTDDSETGAADAA